MSLRSILFPAKWRAFRLFLSLVYLGLLFSAAGYLYRSILFFEGDLFLDTASSARWVARPSGGGGALFSAQHNAPAGVLLPSFEHRIAARYGRDVSVDAANLGFRLRLVSVRPLEEFPPRETVEIDGPGGARTETVESGKVLPLDAVQVRMVEARPWAGLLRSPLGAPMACVTPQGGSDKSRAPVFLYAERWQRCGPDFAFCLRWFPDQATAEKALAARLEDTGARWGASEGKRVQAFSSFAPGTGVTLGDGTEVTLLSRRAAEEEHPSAILGETRKAGEVRPWTVEANHEAEGLPLFYECPAESNEAVVLHAWRDGAVLAGCYRRGVLTVKQMLEEGVTLTPPQAMYSFRLEQVMAKAAAAKPDSGGAWQLIVDAGQGEIGLRQGMAMPVGDYRLTYHRTVPPPRLEYTLAVGAADTGQSSYTVSLESGKRTRIGGWRVTAPLESADPAQGLVMRAERTPGGPVSMFGAFLFAAGSFGWVLCFYFAPRATR